MAKQFDYFVILAGMRTGSNYLESSLNAYDGINSLGEVFNPHFIGKPKLREMYGINMGKREENPLLLIEQIKAQPDGIAGFRFFFDHDPRVLSACLADKKCAKIILTRNFLETYISREIARETDQWRLGKLQDARSAKIPFSKTDFVSHVSKNRAFQEKIDHVIQTAGQTAFRVEYGDLSDIEVLNGMARFLGASEIQKKASRKTKKQNPSSLREKVTNFAEMEKALTDLLLESLEEEPSFETPRGPAIPSYIPAASSPLLFMPVLSGPSDRVCQWMADLDKVDSVLPEQTFTQKTLRQWKRQAKSHRSFTVIRHPVARLHDAFVRRILSPGDQSYPLIRNALISGFGMKLLDHDTIQDMDADVHRKAFRVFVEFVRGNLNGQTSLRVDPSWASQSNILRGWSEFASPDYVFREHELTAGLEFLAVQLGMQSPQLKADLNISPIPLEEIYDQELEAEIKACYQRDYMMFGFGPWQPKQ